MKITIGRTELLNVLNTCSKSVKNGFVIATSCFRFQLIGGELFVSACNLETSTSKTISVNSFDEDFDILIQADQIKKYLSLLPDQPVTFEFERFDVKEEVFYNIVIKSSNGECKMTGYDGGDNFPEIKTTGGDKFTLPFEDLHEAVYRTAYAMAANDEYGETVNKLSAVNLKLSGNSAEFASFNGHSFALFKIAGNFNNAVLLLPDAIVNIIYNLSLKGDCEIEYSDKSLSIKVDGLEIKSILRDGKFVEYEKLLVVPKSYTCVDRPTLISAIKRVLLFSNKTAQHIAISINESSLSISGEDVDFNYKAKETIACSEFKDPVRIGVNGNFALEALNRLTGNELYIYLSTPYKPLIFKENIDDENMSLLAPVTLSTVE